ncbi:MAG: hypothetical protein IPJ48_05095 [Propionivibrio sp.]|uniref:Uncharacterized protein n=1 Tax=Candidatus Propionivibrio dominans TaxID=2954373 RepID=A0A9D7IH02_9RHOO|nr:hypothetical protein [Candidatus Propionivibrio dominans]
MIKLPSSILQLRRRHLFGDADPSTTVVRGGYIQGQDYLRLVGLIDAASDADELLNAASKVKNGVLPGDALFAALEKASTR